MINFLNKEYYIDIDEAIKSCQIIEPNIVEAKNNNNNNNNDDEDDDNNDDLQINVFKFDIIKMCIDRVLNNYEDNQEISNLYNDNKSFKVAFATLIKNKILIEIEEYDDEFE